MTLSNGNIFRLSSRKNTQRKQTYYKKLKQRNMQQSKFNNGRTIRAFLPLFSRCWIFDTHMYQNRISHFYLFHIPSDHTCFHSMGNLWRPLVTRCCLCTVAMRTVRRRLFYNFLTTGLNKRTVSKLSSRWYGDFYDMLETSWVFDTHKIIDLRSISVIKARPLPKPMPTSRQLEQIALNSESICTSFIQRHWLENVVHALIC